MKFHLDSNTFVISDSHFGHKNASKKEPIRKTLAKQYGFENFDMCSIHLWNQKIKDDDYVLHLGDLYFKQGWLCLNQLKGTKKLIVGNNDLKKYKILKNFDDWSICKKIQLKIENKQKILNKLSKKWSQKALKDKLLNTIVVDLGIHRVMFSHFPVFERKKYDSYRFAREILDDIYKTCDCSINIHGHTHSKDTQNKFCINVSGEKLDFKPIKISDILSSI